MSTAKGVATESEAALVVVVVAISTRGNLTATRAELNSKEINYRLD